MNFHSKKTLDIMRIQEMQHIGEDVVDAYDPTVKRNVVECYGKKSTPKNNILRFHAKAFPIKKCYTC